MQLEGKTALITGGGTGIGYSIAEMFAQAGAQVVITGRREEKLKAACEQIQAEKTVRYHTADITDRQQVKALVDWSTEEFGQIDILVNNAGVNVKERSLDVLSPDTWDYLMAVNTDGVFNTIHAVLPQMRARRDGVIINISSIAGLRAALASGLAYITSKHAVTGLTRAIVQEERENGIRATLISPGEVDTSMMDARPTPPTKEQRARILRPEDVAQAVLYVAALPPYVNVPELVIKPVTQEFP